MCVCVWGGWGWGGAPCRTLWRLARSLHAPAAGGHRGTPTPARLTCTCAPNGEQANGEFRGPDAAERYAETVQRACDAKGGKMGAFFIESGMSVAGVIIPPKDYLKRCYAIVRGAGGVCIADEVQTGFGRVGTHWWAFEQYGVVPDIVTMGKPFGNGMPLAAVVCTKEVASRVPPPPPSLPPSLPPSPCSLLAPHPQALCSSHNEPTCDVRTGAIQACVFVSSRRRTRLCVRAEA